MLALFRNNRTTSAILLLVYVVLTRILALAGYIHPDPAETAPGGLVYQHLFGGITQFSGWSVAAAAILVYIQSLGINYVADQYRLLPDRTWLPGVFYVLVTAFLPEFLYVSPPLVAVTFIPAAIFYIFKSYKVLEVQYRVFDSAFWLTVGSLFYPPVFLLHIAGFVGLLLVRSFKFRERVVYVVGIIIPFFLAWLWFYWQNLGKIFWRGQLTDFFGWYHFSPEWSTRTIAEISLVVLLFLVLTLSYGAYTNRKLIQVRNYVQVLYLFLLVSVLSILLQGNVYNTHLLLFMPAAGIFLSMSISQIRRGSLAELLHLVLLAAAFFMQIL